MVIPLISLGIYWITQTHDFTGRVCAADTKTGTLIVRQYIPFRRTLRLKTDALDRYKYRFRYESEEIIRIRVINGKITQTNDIQRKYAYGNSWFLQGLLPDSFIQDPVTLKPTPNIPAKPVVPD